MRQHESGFDVTVLRGLIAPAEQDYQHLVALSVVNPVAGANIDFQLINSAGQHAVLPRIAFEEPVNPRMNACTTLDILEPLQPCVVYIGFAERN